MGKKLTTFEKLRRSFEAIGVTISQAKNNVFFEFEYDCVPYKLFIFEEQEEFCLAEYVVGPDGNPPKQTFETALDVTKSYYDKVAGEWLEECSWVSSPYYSLKGRRNIPKTYLHCIIKKFFEAHSFMSANVFLLMDETIWGEAGEDAKE